MSLSLSLPVITECEIMTAVSSLTNSSPGWDNLPARLLKLYTLEYIKPLPYIINKSFETGVFPGDLKVASYPDIYIW